MKAELSESFLRLVQIMDELREKCPWDKKQTIQTLRQMTIEEMYELADAITDEDWKGIKEELGDLLLHIIFYSKIGSEQKQFELTEVIDGISDKLIARHPHIYGDVVVNDDEDVKKNWEKLKLKEGKSSVLGGVPKALPAMVKAMRLQEKARQVGFEWENKEQVWEKVEEEIAELQAEVSKMEQQRDSGSREGLPEAADAAFSARQEAIEDELGDVFFSLINYARFLRIDAENALERTNKKFIHRFTQMEQQALSTGKDLQTMSLSEMDNIWNTIKRRE